MPRLERSEPLTKQLVDQMRTRIEAGQFKDNQKLPSENELIHEFGVSRAVVREAISNLKAIGMVATRQGVGAFVVRTSANTPFQIEEASLDILHEIVSVLEVRIALEMEAAYLAAARRTAADLKAMKSALRSMAHSIRSSDPKDDGIKADLDFHSSIARATGNKHFLSLFGYLGALLIPRSRLRTSDIHGLSRSEYLDVVRTEHEAIFAAIERKDADGARAAMAEHLGRSKARIQAKSDSRRGPRARPARR